jgi:hypothetical protein
MNLEFYIFLFVAGIVAGISSGLLGIGGALIIIPILRYVPGMIGLYTLPLHLITGITSMQTTFGTAAAAYFHHKSGNVRFNLVVNVGIGIAVGALTGAIVSKFLSEKILLIIYALFLSMAAFLLLINTSSDKDIKPDEEIIVPKYKTMTFGVIVGSLAGALGFGGNVVIIPLLNTMFGVSMKICISSGTFIALIASFMSFIGKLSTSQVELLSAVIISISATIGAFIGTHLNKKASPGFLKYLLLAIILLTLIGVSGDILKFESILNN